MMFETRKILGDESIGVAVMGVRVPLPVCHSEAVNVQTRQPLSAEEARQLLAVAHGVIVEDLPTPPEPKVGMRYSSAGYSRSAGPQTPLSPR